MMNPFISVRLIISFTVLWNGQMAFFFFSEKDRKISLFFPNIFLWNEAMTFLFFSANDTDRKISLFFPNIFLWNEAMTFLLFSANDTDRKMSFCFLRILSYGMERRRFYSSPQTILTKGCLSLFSEYFLME